MTKLLKFFKENAESIKQNNDKTLYIITFGESGKIGDTLILTTRVNAMNDYCEDIDYKFYNNGNEDEFILDDNMDINYADLKDENLIHLLKDFNKNMYSIKDKFLNI